jgi:hypothetical protein
MQNAGEHETWHYCLLPLNLLHSNHQELWACWLNPPLRHLLIHLLLLLLLLLFQLLYFPHLALLLL